MRRTSTYLKSIGFVRCPLPTGKKVRIPVFVGVFKHATADSLFELLKSPDAARKYTVLALQHASWPLLRKFPHHWLHECMKETPLRPGRRKALKLLLNNATAR
ncbi:MAG: hypothetical protein HY360_18150 [Verrucomicrobia bacterium]|nr:hypothetical protein [Verrucomicrobiota bacterium]